MEYLDLSNIEQRFLSVAGLDESSLAGCRDFIALGKYYVESRLKASPDPEDSALCEYCAACAANYYYTCARLSRDRNMVTSAGLYPAAEDRTKAAASAAKLLSLARQGIAPLLEGGEDFAFAAV